MEVKIYRIDKELPLPKFETPNSAGIDLRSVEDLVLRPGERYAVDTGIKIEMPCGYEAQVRPRSGLAIKKGITVLNTPGTIDSDYRGEIKVILINLSNEDFYVKKGERIAQLVFKKVEQPNFIEVSSETELEDSQRGEGGLGSTGTN